MFDYRLNLRQQCGDCCRGFVVIASRPLVSRIDFVRFHDASNVNGYQLIIAPFNCPINKGRTCLSGPGGTNCKEIRLVSTKCKNMLPGAFCREAKRLIASSSQCKNMVPGHCKNILPVSRRSPETPQPARPAGFFVATPGSWVALPAGGISVHGCGNLAGFYAWPEFVPPHEADARRALLRKGDFDVRHF